MPQRNHKIVVADDDSALLFSITDILEDEGYKVTGSEDGRQAIEAAATENAKLVLLDVQMPGIGGVEAFRRIKEASPDTYVVMMTGLPADEFINEAVHESSYTVLYKPMHTRQILSAVQSLAGAPCVLVVEDEPSDRELLKMVFEDDGFRCAEASDGSQAVLKMANEELDVVMVDIKISGTSVFESCQEILTINPDTKIVFVTDYQIEQTAKMALSAGAFSVLTKPVDPDHMLRLVHSLMAEAPEDSAALRNGDSAAAD